MSKERREGGMKAAIDMKDVDKVVVFGLLR